MRVVLGIELGGAFGATGSLLGLIVASGGDPSTGGGSGASSGGALRIEPSGSAGRVAATGD